MEPSHLYYSLFVLLWCIAPASSRLFLTPYVYSGAFQAARQQSLVIDEDGVIPRSHSGFITVDMRLGNHLFFWYFPALDSRAPLLVWLSGGPTISSMVEVFFGNGPMRTYLRQNGEVDYIAWNNSWTNSFSMLYIDNPVGTGFSYTESEKKGYRTTQEGYARDLYNFLEQFYKIFPECVIVDLYIGGESYAGKYVPSFGYHLHREIKHGKSRVPFKGIYIGGPYFDPRSHWAYSADYFYTMGSFSYNQTVEYRRYVKLFWEKHDNHALTTYSLYEIANQIPRGLPVSNYAQVDSPSAIGFDDLLNSKKMKKLLHTEGVSYTYLNYMIADKFFHDYFTSAKSKLAVLLDNYKVLVFNGDLDAITSTVLIDVALMSTPWTSQEAFNSSMRSPWLKDSKLIGYYSLTGKFCRVILRQCGHTVPHDQPEVSLLMMQQFIRDGCVH